VRVAAGAIARKWLRERYGITVRGWMSRLGEIDIPFSDESAIDGNPFFAPDAGIVPKLETYMDALRKSGDSVGAEVTVVARGVPVGWGDPVYDRLDADIAYAMMGINAVKGVEIGAGFRSVTQKGSEHGDELTPQGFLSNNAGGVLGGIHRTGGRGAHRRQADLQHPPAAPDHQRRGRSDRNSTLGRHDPCVGIRATPIAEAMLALVLIDAALRHRAQCGDVNCPTPKIAGQGTGPRLIKFFRIFSKTIFREEIMRVDHHDLYTEFPDMRDAIDALEGGGRLHRQPVRALQPPHRQGRGPRRTRHAGGGLHHRRHEESPRQAQGRDLPSAGGFPRRSETPRLTVPPHGRLAVWYFWYFAFIGAFLPYFALYLQSLGLFRRPHCGADVARPVHAAAGAAAVELAGRQRRPARAHRGRCHGGRPGELLGSLS
jgi:hypothetical protein